MILATLSSTQGHSSSELVAFDSRPRAGQILFCVFFAIVTKEHTGSSKLAAVEMYMSYKMLILGDSGVGKTNIVSRYVSDTFSHAAAPTIALDFTTVEVPLAPDGSPLSPRRVQPTESAFDLPPTQRDEEIVRVQIWDTAGEERYHALSSTVYRGAVAALVVFDITRRKSFEGLGKWTSDFLHLSGTADPTILIVGNKVDLEHLRAVSTQEAVEFAESVGAAYVETSALHRTNIEKCFELLVGTMHKKVSHQVNSNRGGSSNRRKGRTLSQSGSFEPVSPPVEPTDDSNRGFLSRIVRLKRVPRSSGKVSELGDGEEDDVGGGKRCSC